MEIRYIRALRGPNIWARFPVLEALVDLQEFKDTGTDSIPGFNERVMGWLPTMIEHRCGPGVHGGFFKRMRQGTWLGHVLEHVTLELQALSYKDAGYGKARETPEEGVYRVAFRYRDEQHGRACMETGFQLIMAAAYDLPFDIDTEVAKLKELAIAACLPEVVYHLQSLAKDRGIPTLRLNRSVLQLGYGCEQRRINGLTTDRTSATGLQAAQDKELVELLLQSVQVVNRDALEGDLHRLVMIDGEVSVAVRCVEEKGQWTYTDVTAKVGRDAALKAMQAARVVGLDIAGVDIRARDIQQPLIPQRGGVFDLHANPNLDTYLPLPEVVTEVARDMLDYLFPTRDDGRIPIACVTGVNGKTTTTRLLASMVDAAGFRTGMTCTDGVFVAGERIEAADCSGPNSARIVLRHPEMEAGVFEVARGGILRGGLGFDRADVSIVTNIGEGDHLGINYINTAEQLAYVKSTVIDAVREESGTGVLNANDALTVEMRTHCRGKLTFFAIDERHPVIVSHRQANGTAFFIRDGVLIAGEATGDTAVLPLSEVPLTRGGLIGFQIENVLAATAAAWALEIPLDLIQRVLRTFDSDIAQTPGRFNVLERKGATIILDYGHNPSAIVSLIESIEKFPHPRRTVVYGADGDRRDDQIIRQAALLGDAFDRVILYEEPSRRRGRAENECYELLETGVRQGKRTSDLLRVDGEKQAIAEALRHLQSGELLLIQIDAVDADLAFIEELLKG